ncbi:hypothetical protein KY285_023251 [Solanum tuberosum]|nr:hypothetical protein KY285_023251 [Solanum tuberosum]
MQPSNLLPISNPNSPPSMLIPTSSVTADTMLVRSEPHIIHSSSSSTILHVEDDDDSKIETKPLLTRAFSYSSSSSSSSSNLVMQQRRRRIASANSLLSGAVEGCRREMGRAASDTYVVTRLSFRLLRYLG